MLKLGDGVGVDRAERIGRVEVRADEIHRHLAVGAVAGEVVEPGVARTCWAADLQARVDPLERRGGGVVEREAVGLRAGPERLEVRLVPALERPLRDLADAVTLDPMAREPLDQVAPGSEIVRWRDVALVVEDDLVAGKKHARHEREFDDRLHSDRQQKVEGAGGV